MTETTHHCTTFCQTMVGMGMPLPPCCPGATLQASLSFSLSVCLPISLFICVCVYVAGGHQAGGSLWFQQGRQHLQGAGPASLADLHCGEGLQEAVHTGAGRLAHSYSAVFFPHHQWFCFRGALGDLRNGAGKPLDRHMIITMCCLCKFFKL